MPRRRLKLDQRGEAHLVHERLAQEPAGLARERLVAISLGLKGELTLAQIAEQLGRSRATIQTWFDLYRTEGVERVCSRSKAPTGRPSELTPKIRKELAKKLAKGSFRRVEDARSWLSKQFRVKPSYNTVRYWMGKLQARLKVPRPRNPQSCDLKRDCFRRQLARQLFASLKERELHREKRPVRIWVQDEARFGLHPCIRRAWITKGVRAHKSSRTKFDWQYIWGALQVGGGGSEFLYSNKADGDVSIAFLKQISKRDPYAIHLVIWDGASFHPLNKDPRMPDNVVVLRQPPYSPELNAVEKLWDCLRDHLCNRKWSTLDELLNTSIEWLKGFWNDPLRIQSLVGQGWTLSQANV